MLEIVVFALIAGVLLWKLRSMLGQDDGTSFGGKGFFNFHNQKGAGSERGSDAGSGFRAKSPMKEVKDVMPAAKDVSINTSPSSDISHLGFRLLKKPDSSIRGEFLNSDAQKLKTQLALIPDEGLHSVYTDVYKLSNSTVLMTHFIEGAEVIFEEIMSVASVRDLSVLDDLSKALTPECLKKLRGVASDTSSDEVFHLERVVEMVVRDIAFSGFVVNIAVNIRYSYIKFAKDADGSVVSGSKSVPVFGSCAMTFSRDLSGIASSTPSFWVLNDFVLA